MAQTYITVAEPYQTIQNQLILHQCQLYARFSVRITIIQTIDLDLKLLDALKSKSIEELRNLSKKPTILLHNRYTIPDYYPGPK